MIIDGSRSGFLWITQYVNGYEQFILYSRKEIDQDGELNSIEFSYLENNQQNSVLVS